MQVTRFVKPATPKDYFMLKTTNKASGQEEQLQCWFTALFEARDQTADIAFNAKWPRDICLDNPLTGILHHKQDVSFNFVLQDGQASEYPCTDLDLQEVKVPDDARVSRIRIREFNESWHPDMYGSLERQKQPSMFS